jgi:hypothetical protein
MRRPQQRERSSVGVASVAAIVALSGCGLDVPDGNAVAPVPFAVSDQFTASGFMGDGASPGVVTLHVDDAACLPRPSGAAGSCYAFVYDAPAAGGLGWAGVYWQSPVGNWGQFPGKPIAPGATRVAFQAATVVGGAAIDFRVGGLAGGSDPVTGAPYRYGDTLDASATVTPTTALAPYQLSFPPGATYERVLGGFAWSATLAPGSTMTLYLDDIRWEP